jgi:GNAT superfamily N-acetyltransferase
MKSSTRAEVEQWWRALFDVDDELWSSVTVRRAGAELADYEGWYVAWRDDGVHVAAPSHAAATERKSLSGLPALELQELEFWHSFARSRQLVVIGPGVHHYLDTDPGPATRVQRTDPRSLFALREQVSDEDWDECGFDDALARPAVVAFATDGGAAVLTELAGAPRDVNLLVAPGSRGGGLGTELGRAAASYAVREHGYARWRCRETNVPSTRAAARLGFEPYATQLAVRRAG